MDLYLLISVMSVMHSWTCSTALSAPAGGSPTSSAVTQGRHVRTKRCSCATFMDKECVYFCHLDIIWVNTPERVVSYGLGNAPRTKRAAEVSMATGGGPRCRCSRESDTTCRNFCEPDKPIRYESSADTLIRAAQGDAHKQAAAAPRTEGISQTRGSPPVLWAAVKSRLLLEKWRARRRHRARTWEGESTAS